MINPHARISDAGRSVSAWANGCARTTALTRRRSQSVSLQLQLCRSASRERVVDLGCGRGALLTMLARLVPRGRAVGVDLWRSVEQPGNDPTGTLNNAAAEAVTVDLITADMRALPLAGESVDLVVSTLAIHNIPDGPGRMTAVIGPPSAMTSTCGVRCAPAVSCSSALRQSGWSTPYTRWRPEKPCWTGRSSATWSSTSHYTAAARPGLPGRTDDPGRAVADREPYGLRLARVWDYARAADVAG